MKLREQASSRAKCADTSRVEQAFPPEPVGPHPRARLVVLGVEVGGRVGARDSDLLEPTGARKSEGRAQVAPRKGRAGMAVALGFPVFFFFLRREDEESSLTQKSSHTNRGKQSASPAQVGHVGSSAVSATPRVQGRNERVRERPRAGHCQHARPSFPPRQVD